MKNFSIGKKLTFCFISVCIMFLICISMVTFGFVNSNMKIKRLYNDNLIGIGLVGQMSEMFQEERAMMRSIMLFESTTDTYTNSLNRLKLCNDEMNKYFLAYRNTIIVKEDEELFAKIEELYNGDYNIYKLEMFEFTSKNDIVGAKERMNIAAPINTNLVNYFNEITILNDKYASEALMASQKNFKIIFSLSLVIIILVLIIQIFILKYLNMNISKKIKVVVDAAKSLAKGKINIDLSVDTKDEIGELMDSFNEMVRSIKNQADVVVSISKGDLTIEHKPLSEYDVMGHSLVKTLIDLENTFKTFNAAAVQVNSGAGQLSASAQSLSLLVQRNKQAL